MLPLIVESAVRACVLAAIVWLALHAMRMRDARLQITVWTMVLIASLSMPLLMQWTRVELHVPILQPPNSASATVKQKLSELSSPIIAGNGISLGELAFGIYLAIAGVLLLRLIVGIALTTLMRRAAQPLAAFEASPFDSANLHAHGCDIRVSAAVRSPVTFATTILVPKEFVEWPAPKQRAVISHEQSHVEQGDFYLQLLANVCRAIFWFSPLAWWLQHRLASLAETIGDDAAINDGGDRKHYATTLLEIAQKTRAVAGAVAMARPVTVKQRVAEILGGRSQAPQTTGRNRLLVSLAMIPLIAVTAGCVIVPLLRLDGQWQATMPPEGRCQFTAVLTLQVKGNAITGEITNPEGVFPVEGDIDVQGRGNLRMRKYWGVIEFTGDHFEADYSNGCGGRHAVGTRI